MSILPWLCGRKYFAVFQVLFFVLLCLFWFRLGIHRSPQPYDPPIVIFQQYTFVRTFRQMEMNHFPERFSTAFKCTLYDLFLLSQVNCLKSRKVLDIIQHGQLIVLKVQIVIRKKQTMITHSTIELIMDGWLNIVTTRNDCGDGGQVLKAI